MNTSQFSPINSRPNNLRSQAALPGSVPLQRPNQFYQNLSKSFNSMNGGYSTFRPMGGGYSSFRQQSPIAQPQANQGQSTYYQNMNRLNSQSQPALDFRRQAATDLLKRQSYSDSALGFGGAR